MANLDLSPFKVKADIMWAFLDTPNQITVTVLIDRNSL